VKALTCGVTSQKTGGFIMERLYIALTYKFEKEAYAKELADFLEYSNIKGVKWELDPLSEFYIVSVLEEQFETANKLAKAFHTEKVKNSGRGEELSEKESTAGRSYMSAEEKYNEMSSTSSAFLLIGVVGLAVSILALLKIIPLPIVNDPFSGIIMAALCCIFIAIGIHSFKSAKDAQDKIKTEKTVKEDITKWFYENYNGEIIDKELGIFSDVSKSSQENYFKRDEKIKMILLNYNHDIDELLLESLAEEFYSSLYEKDDDAN